MIVRMKNEQIEHVTSLNGVSYILLAMGHILEKEPLVYVALAVATLALVVASVFLVRNFRMREKWDKSVSVRTCVALFFSLCFFVLCLLYLFWD